ncbi:DUF6796 family protein [Pseudoramibacter sp. HA2172]|uniref:DUF6796 family protein n=1 Tax=Pseudoramibacter faecis TaxID=3108534 RepID=UPI002E7744CD|nr:DUF6796 family protein [Pseudoramibacter sp. HA2172]
MKNLTSRQRILLAVPGFILFIIGDYLLGFGTIGTSSAPNALYGMEWRVASDWRYACSSFLGFVGTAFYAAAAVELLHVMETKYHTGASKLYRLFRIANWGGILYFAFIHIGLGMLPMVFNAGMAATGDMAASAAMAVRVAKSIALPLIIGYIICDGFLTVGWIGMVVRGMLPVRKLAWVCNPVVIAIFGQLINVITEGLDAGFESLGWLLLYLVCAVRLVEKEERI